MGSCLSSGGHGNLEQVDDSVHVMLKHDRKKRKESGAPATSGYKPRAANPALEEKRAETANGGGAAAADANPAAPAGGEEKTEESADAN